MSSVRFAPLLGLIAAIALGCSGATTEHADDELATATPATVLDVVMRDMAFVPPTLQVTSDQVIDLRIENAGALDHDFTIERIPADALVMGEQAAEHQGHGVKYPVHAAPGPGKSITLRLHPHQAGTYTYYCTVKGHREAGMTGTLVVS